MQYENLSLLRTHETRTTRKSKKDFYTELRFLEASFEVFLKTFGVLSKDYYKKFRYSKDATYRISYRIFRIVQCAVNCSLEGYYDVSTALLRIAYENHLFMNYLSKDEDEAKLWFEGKRFAPNFIRRNVSYASDSLYQDMSEFIHSSFKSTFAFTTVWKDKTMATLGEYNKEEFREVLLLTLMTTATTLIWLSLVFAQELMQNKEWRCMFRNVIPNMWKHIKKNLKRSR